MSKITFKNQKCDFTTALKKEVNDYFTTKNIKPTGNFQLHLKSIILISLAVACYTVLVFFTPINNYAALSVAALLGIVMAGIGFNVMHDGSHGSYSDNKFVNILMAQTLNVMGGSSVLWKVKHNFVHHTYTNIEDHDDDIDIKPFIRMTIYQPKKWFHSFQHYYFLFLYTQTYTWWVLGRDYARYFSGKIGQKSLSCLTLTDHLTFWIGKAVFISIFIITPIYMVGWSHFWVGFMTMSVFNGLLLSIIFQLAHSVEETQFMDEHTFEELSEHNWIRHQIATTANFCTTNPAVTWFTGGLNFQIEHHLFPKISHIHYPQISKIVKRICDDYEVEYTEFKSMAQAIGSHFKYIKAVGMHA